MSFLFSSRHTFSQRIVAICMGITHVFLIGMVSPIILFGVWILESVVKSYTGVSFDVLLPGESEAQIVVVIFVAVASIAVATFALKTVLVERIYGRIALNISILTMVVTSWTLAMMIGAGRISPFGGFSQAVLTTLFSVLPVFHFFLAQFLVTRMKA